MEEKYLINTDEFMDFLDEAENIAEENLKIVLSSVLNGSNWLLRNTPDVVLLSKGKEHTLVQNVQHMLLKQALTSLRATNLLCLRGYTSQAASVASGLFELRLYSNFIGLKNSRAEEFLNHSNSQDFVWQPKKMIRHEAETRINLFSEKCNEGTVKKATELINASYVFLCSLKHSNPIPLRHAVGARDNIIGSSFKDGGFPVISLPDTREEDNSTKATILVTANNSTFYITRNVMMSGKDDSAEWQSWFTTLNLKWDEVAKSSKLGLSNFGSLPFPTTMR